MRIRAISKSSCVRQDHEEMPAAEYSLAETKAELGERCPTRSFYEKPTEWLAARAGRDPFPVYCLVPNRNRRESEFAVRHGGLSEEWLRSTVAEIDSTRIHLWCLSFLEVSDHWLKSDRKYRRDLRRRRPPFHISQSDDASRDRCALIARPQHKIPTSPLHTSAAKRWNPGRSTKPEPVRPRSSSMTRICWKPRVRARSARLRCRRVLS